MPSTGINSNLLLLDLQTDTIRSRDRQTDMDGGIERKIEWSYPQVVFAAERLQQLLIVLVTHLSQKRQQTCHKFSLTTQHIMRGRRWSFNVVAYSDKLFFFCPFGGEMSLKNKIYCALKIIVELVRIVLMLTGFLKEFPPWPSFIRQWWSHCHPPHHFHHSRTSFY